MEISIPDKASYIIDKLKENGFEAYVVGGCIRDACLGRKPEDWDITTSARPEQVKEIFRRTIDTGIAHGTVTVMLDKDGYEVTTYRIDGEYEDSRHPKEVVFTGSLKDDLMRRDFTINAMAYNKTDGLVDIFGGLEDLRNGLVRCVGKPEERFSEDALRILRAVRFSGQLGMEIEKETWQAMKKKVESLRNISAERIRSELDKLLRSSHPQQLLLAYNAGITSVVLPEFNHMMSTDQRNPHHSYTVGMHTIKALMELEQKGNSKERTILTWAVLLHDAAKPETKTTDEKGRDHFKGHPSKSAEIAKKVLKRFKFDNYTIDTVYRLIYWHDYRYQLTEAAIRKAMNKIGNDILDWLLMVQRADIMAQSNHKREEKLLLLERAEELIEKVRERQQCICLKDLAVNGNDLMEAGCPKGQEVGKLLGMLLELVLEEPEKNQKELLLQITQNYLKTDCRQA